MSATTLATVNTTPEVTAIAAAWKNVQQTEKYGMEFGRLCYEYQQKYATVRGVGNKGKGIVPTLEQLNIPVSTAYWWIDRYKEQAGLKPPREVAQDETTETVVPAPKSIEPHPQQERTLEGVLDKLVERIALQPYGYSAAKFKAYPEQHTTDLAIIELAKHEIWKRVVEIGQAKCTKIVQREIASGYAAV